MNLLKEHNLLIAQTEAVLKVCPKHDSLIQYDYMGNSEFEFGALSKSLKRIMSDIYKENFKCYKIIINNEEFIVFSKVLLDNGKEIEDFMQLAYTKKYGVAKVCIYIDRYFEGETHIEIKKNCKHKTVEVDTFGYCNFWWDIYNDWMLVPNSEMYVVKLTQALLMLKEKGFGKDA